MAGKTAAELEALLRGADIVPLTMALVTATGDLRLLDEIAPYVRGPWDFSERVPEDVRRRIVARCVRMMQDRDAGDRPPAPQLSDETLRRMMSVAVGGPVEIEYVPMLTEHMALRRTCNPAGEEACAIRNPRECPDGTREIRALVIGAGASGICAAIKLSEIGIAYTVLEKNDEVGGTWYENHYPGCAVDTPNHFYQFSFEPNNDWPNYFSRQESILAYLKHCTDKYGVRPHIRFGQEVLSAKLDSEAKWRVLAKRRDGTVEAHCADVLICAVGQLNRPAIPDIPGLADFSGEVLHTAAWEDDADLSGKRVALIGTGASAVQVGPALVDRVASLHVYQRSPAWVARSPNVHRAVSDEKKWALKHVPYYAEWYRFQLFWAFGDDRFKALEVDPDWTQPGTISALNQQYREIMERHIRRELEGREDLVDKAIPRYPPFGKRVLADAGWYKMLRREHVELVTTGIERIGEDAVHLKDGRAIATDAIVFATGFQAGRMLWPMEIEGRDGRSIRETWGDDDPRAYLGIAVPGFPNMFVMYGPNTNLGHGGSAIFLAECQMRYIAKLLARMAGDKLKSVEIRQDVHDAYNNAIDEKLRNLVWSHPSVDSWYKNKQGRIITNQPWRLIDYWRLTYQPDMEHYAVTADSPGGPVRLQEERT